MQILGITGGVATGKSTVTRMLAERGAPTVSADVLARDLLSPGTPTTLAVLAAFPACADPADPGGQTVDRRALGRLVFADQAARDRLETLTHPAIIAALERQIAARRRSAAAPAAAAEIPLLFEAGLEPLADCIVVVTCAEATQIARLRARLGADDAEARRILDAQWPPARKAANADCIITTDGALEDTRRQVEALWKQVESPWKAARSLSGRE